MLTSIEQHALVVSVDARSSVQKRRKRQTSNSGIFFMCLDSISTLTQRHLLLLLEFECFSRLFFILIVNIYHWFNGFFLLLSPAEFLVFVKRFIRIAQRFNYTRNVLRLTIILHRCQRVFNMIWQFECLRLYLSNIVIILYWRCCDIFQTNWNFGIQLIFCVHC